MATETILAAAAAGKRRLAGDIARSATSGEVKHFRREALASKPAPAGRTARSSSQTRFEPD